MITYLIIGGIVYFYFKIFNKKHIILKTLASFIFAWLLWPLFLMMVLFDILDEKVKQIIGR